MANLFDGLEKETHAFFLPNENGLSPYSLVYELPAAPLLSMADAQEKDGRR